jgi:hypothetical protein
MEEKSSKKDKIRKEKNIKTEALISFSERAGLWVVRIPRRRGGYKVLDYYDSEEEAIEAKDAYFKELDQTALKCKCSFNNSYVYYYFKCDQ